MKESTKNSTCGRTSQSKSASKSTASTSSQTKSHGNNPTGINQYTKKTDKR